MTTKKPDAADWSFLRRPFWIFSHLFALTVVASFVLLGFWQLNRYHQRVDHNTVIASRTAPPAVDLSIALGTPADQLDYQLVAGQGRYVADDVVRVANRSQGGVAGQHLVSVFQLDDGRELLVNRGFVPLDDDVPVLPAPTGEVTVEGWLRASVARETFGATDTGRGDVVPRLDVSAIQERLGPDEPVEPVWLQLAPSSQKAARATFPDPVPLPELTDGPHLSYMGQWWIFAALGVGFYLALLRRTARRGAAPVSAAAPEAEQPKLGV
ncbi:MAG: SURF1 family protein [Acidimicrobiales bacterium]